MIEQLEKLAAQNKLSLNQLVIQCLNYGCEWTKTFKGGIIIIKKNLQCLNTLTLDLKKVHFLWMHPILIGLHFLSFHVLDGKYFVNSSGSRLEGTMPNKGNGPIASTSRVVGNNNVYFRMNPGRYTSSYSGSIYNTTSEADKPEVYATYAQVASLVGLTGSKLMQGQTVLGVAGTGTSDGTAVAADISPSCAA